MNYIIQDNIDFFKEIKNWNDDDNASNLTDDEKCLLTNSKLVDNFITLPCNHKFNYMPLYLELIKQKKNYNKYLEVTHLNINQIKCPYCRNISDQLIPFFNIDNITSIKGVNCPSKYCMKINSCTWINKSGKHKGQICSKNAYILNDNIYCDKHHKTRQKNSNNDNNSDNSEIESSEKFIMIDKNYKILELKNILKHYKIKVSGKKKELITRLILDSKSSNHVF